MKKIIVLVVAISILCLSLFLFFRRGKIIQKASHYRIYTSTGKTIPADLYIEESENTDSTTYLLVFDNSLDFDEDHSLLIIAGKYQFIGIPELSANEIIKISDKNAFQCRENPNPITAVDNSFFFDDSLLNYAIFKDDKVVFNTYGPLKKYGDSAILEIGR